MAQSRSPGRSAADAELDKDVLFGTPPDLSCPITQEVFLDPVLTAAGQVTSSFCHHHYADVSALAEQTGTSITSVTGLDTQGDTKAVLQVYERTAIEKHFKRAQTDPVTGGKVSSTQLTPVYMLRSRALEWRQATARECIQRACESDCMDPAALMRYLRRAADLTSHAPVQVSANIAGSRHGRLLQLFGSWLMVASAAVWDRATLTLWAPGTLPGRTGS